MPPFVSCFGLLSLRCGKSVSYGPDKMRIGARKGNLFNLFFAKEDLFDVCEKDMRPALCWEDASKYQHNIFRRPRPLADSSFFNYMPQSSTADDFV